MEGMANELPAHRSFPQDDRVWRVDWFGQLKFNPHLPSEHTLQILVTPLKNPKGADSSTLNSTASYDHSASRMVNIGVGLLPILRIGMFWHKGKPYELPQGNPVYTRKTLRIPAISIEPNHSAGVLLASDICIAARDGLPGPDGRQYFIPKKYYPLFEQGQFSRDANLAKCLRFECQEVETDAVGRERLKQLTIIVPCVEVFRFYYANSTPLTLALLAGGLETPANDLWNPEPELTYIDPISRAALIQLRMRMKDADAETIARICFSEYAQICARNIPKSITRNFVNHRGAVVEAYPPFCETTRWRVSGKAFKFDGEWQFLVYEILDCTAPLPFSSLGHDRDNDGRVQPEQESKERRDAKPEAFRNLARKRERQPQEKPTEEIENTDEPLLDYPTYEVVNDSRRFLDLLDKTVTKLPQNRTSYRSARSPRPNETDEPSAYSTAHGSYQQSSHGPLVVAQSSVTQLRQRASSRPADFDELERVLDELGKTPGLSWNITQIIPDTSPAPPKSRSLFPIRRHSRGQSNWSFIDKEAMTQRRQALIVEVNYGSRLFYLFESEHRPDVNEKGQLIEQYSMLLLYTVDGSRIGRIDLAEVLRLCVSNYGTWLEETDMSHLIRERIRHASSETVRTAERIIERMQKTLIAEGGSPSLSSVA